MYPTLYPTPYGLLDSTSSALAACLALHARIASVAALGEGVSAFVEVMNVTYRYRGGMCAFENVSLSVKKGQVLGLLGVNGAGKTTFVRLLQGILSPISGSISINGYPPTSLRAKVICGNAPQTSVFPSALRVSEFISYVSKLYPRSESLSAVLDKFHLKDLKNRKGSHMSGGQKRQVAVALAFVGFPSLVLLDEPTAGLDISSRRDVINTVKSEISKRGITAIVTSHYLDDIESLADTVVVLQNGRITHNEPINTLIKHTRGNVVSFFSKSPNRVKNILTKAEKFDISGDFVRVTTPDSDNLLRRLYTSDISLRDIRVQSGTLEDAFVELIRKE